MQPRRRDVGVSGGHFACLLVAVPANVSKLGAGFWVWLGEYVALQIEESAVSSRRSRVNQINV